MIPMVAIVKVEPAGERPIRLWLPLFLVWLLILPFVLVALPFAFIAALVLRMNPFAALAALGGLIAALSDVHVEVHAPDARVLVKLI